MQVIDSSTLSLDEFRQKSGFAQTCEIMHRKRRDVTDALRAAYWYSGVRIRTGIQSARGLELKYEPETLHRAGSPRNKWGKYRDGRHVPSAALVSKVGIKLPGSSRDLNHPLWRILAMDNLRHFNEDHLIAQLRLDIQEILARWDAWKPKSRYRNSSVDQRLVMLLERRASLDSLAAIVLLMRRSHAAEQWEVMHDWTGPLYRTMVMLGSHFMSRGIARPLFELIEQRVLPSQEVAGTTYSMPVHSYLKTIGALENALHHIADSPYALMSEHQKVTSMLRILDGRLGFDYRFAFNPIQTTGRVSRTQSATAEPLDDRGWRLHMWAWNMLNTGGHRKSPPAAVFAGRDLWARRPDC